MKHIAMLSGGRDSTAMVFYMLENNLPIDHILFTDTQSEFDEMYEYLDRVDEKLKPYGHQIKRLQHKRGETFEDWVFGKVVRGNMKGLVRGVPMVTQPCFWKRESKVRPYEKFIKDEGITEKIVYIGYTYSERKRAKVTAEDQRYPLIELKKCEADVDRKLEELDLVNPLYANFERTGCYFCPYQKVRGFYLLWKLYPEKWEYMKSVESRLIAGDPVINAQWGIRYSMEEFEQAFTSGEILYDVESPSACECQI